MKNKKTIKREYEDEIVESITCDICKITFDRKWGAGNFDVLETKISFGSGTLYPEGGYGETIEFDICPDCFVDTIAPFIEGFGSKRQVTDWNV